MGFATVKTSPYAKPSRRQKSHLKGLWTEAQWKRLELAARTVNLSAKSSEFEKKYGDYVPYISEECLELIREFNGN